MAIKTMHVDCKIVRKFGTVCLYLRNLMVHINNNSKLLKIKTSSSLFGG